MDMDHTLQRYIVALTVSILISSCSRAVKPRVEPQPEIQPPRVEVQTLPQEQKPKDKEPVKTIIPDEEKKAAEEASAEDKTNDVRDEASAGLEDALSAYQEAKTLRESGDLDGALQVLDQAYALMLKAQIPPESPLFREKNDLRLLISQRVQEIYASRANPSANGGSAILLVENKWVQDELRSFTTVERASFLEAYKRSGLYRDMILAEIRKEGLPEELSWLPIIESGFTARALSRARALGMWQFIASTGYRYGLSRDRWVDERMDPQKATRAAVQFLRDLHKTFGDWTTALAAYNCGEYGVQRVINTQHVNYLDDFWDLFTRLPFETARFVPRFIAVTLLVQNPAKYGLTLPEPYAALNYESIQVNRPAKLSQIAAAMGLEASELAFLNPELRFDSTPERAYDLKVPVGSTEKALLAIRSVPKYVPPEVSFSWHVVKSGDTLWALARRYGTSVSMITRLNGMRPPYLLLPGKRIKIPGKGGLPGDD